MQTAEVIKRLPDNFQVQKPNEIGFRNSRETSFQYGSYLVLSRLDVPYSETYV